MGGQIEQHKSMAAVGIVCGLGAVSLRNQVTWPSRSATRSRVRLASQPGHVSVSLRKQSWSMIKAGVW